ncbi:GNAT family N-acetyltransferase [Thioalkalivibrio paradoxus]|uniref:N-acetyltransferase domain-containing protein n=1 Tax=Thioalkalivibrio paradoxus ARh 1 TaxID=713585 RepID=W0DMK3_9GAMM|nr:GNAT family N-acetyltransferase [Thioalkalivibrio paradoxus]AHE99819.1 hypothetical protein THITH_00855 [Thioalkalivibrio paradoxus ARh 1]
MTAQSRDIDGLAQLESEAWPSGLRADASTIRMRLLRGHRVVVAAFEHRFVAAACFYHTAADPTNATTFPRDFESFSTSPASTPVRSTYVYNLCVTPAQRGRGSAERVIDAVICDARANGARFLVGDGRCPSYAGTAGPGPDRIRHDPQFQRAIDDWLCTGLRPDLRLLIRDPVLRYYHRRLGCEFLHLAPGFLPEDRASGGFRVIFAKPLGAARAGDGP